MIPTKQQCLDAARFHLGDDQVSGGEIFTNTVLEQPFQMAVRELFRAMENLAVARVQREAYYDLPANTTLLVPSTAGITDLGEIELLEERGTITSVAITNAVNGAGFVTITAAGHPFSTGDLAVIYGVTGMSGINGMNAVTVVDANTFKVNGAVGVGAYVNGGTASKSGDVFVEVLQRDRSVLPLSGTTFQYYAWFEDNLHFPACSAVRELRITYISSAATISASGDTLGIDDGLDFVALRTAGLASSSRGATNRAQALNEMAIGPTLQADGSGGVLRELVATAVRNLQSNPVQRPPFRYRNNDNSFNYLL